MSFVIITKSTLMKHWYLLKFGQLKLLISWILIWAQYADIKIVKLNNFIEQIFLLHETNKDHKTCHCQYWNWHETILHQLH